MGNKIMRGSQSVVIQTRQDQSKKTLNTSCAPKQVHFGGGTCFHGKSERQRQIEVK